MAQRTVEMLIGRLVTDERLLADFLIDPYETLLELCNRGLELSKTEMAALVATDPALWVHAAERIDTRLLKANLENRPTSQKERKDHV